MTEYRFGPFELVESEVVRLWRNDPGSKRIEVSLEPKQKQILLYLVKHHAKVVSRKELYNAVWYNDPNGRRETEENNLSAQISFLREGLGEERGSPRYVQTVTGKGLMFGTEVTIKQDLEQVGVDELRRSIYSSVAIGIGAVALVILLLWFFILRPGKPVRVELDNNVVKTYDSRGRLVWAFALPESSPVETTPKTPDSHSREPILIDLDDDGTPEVLVAHFPRDPSQDGTSLYCLRNGKQVWRRRVGGIVETTNGQHNTGIMIIARFRVLKRPLPNGGRILVLSYEAGGGYTGMLQLLRVNDGERVAQYLNPGWMKELELCDLKGDGVEEVLLGGENDPFGNTTDYQAELVVLYANRINGQAPRPEGNCCYYKDAPLDKEAAVLLFRNLTDGGQHWHVRSLHGNGVISLQVYGYHEYGEALFRFNRHLTIETIQPSMPFSAKLLNGKHPSDEDANKIFIEKLWHVRVLKNDFALRK